MECWGRKEYSGESGLFHCYHVAWPSLLFQGEEAEPNLTCCLLWFGWPGPTATAQAHAAVWPVHCLHFWEEPGLGPLIQPGVGTWK